MIYLALSLWPYLLGALLLGVATGYFARRQGRPS